MKVVDRRAICAAKRYLAKNGYDIEDVIIDSNIDIVASDMAANEVQFFTVDIVSPEDGFTVLEDDEAMRPMFEKSAIEWLADADYVDVEVAFGTIVFMLTKGEDSDRALMRVHYLSEKN